MSVKHEHTEMSKYSILNDAKKKILFGLLPDHDNVIKSDKDAV